MSTTMRAKMVVNSVQRNVQHDGQVGSETVFMNPVCKSRAYPPDGYDEDNTFAKFSPSGELRLVIANPALMGQFKPGQKFWLDFSQAE